MVEKGDIIQITNQEHDWYPALLIVDEPKSFGCQAYAIHLEGRGRSNGVAYNRLNAEDYQRVGRAVIDTE